MPPTWNDKFKLSDESCFVSVIQDYFEYIFRKYNENIDNPSIRIYVNKIENRITFKVKKGDHLELSSLLETNKNKISKEKNGEYIRFYIHLFQTNHELFYD